MTANIWTRAASLCAPGHRRAIAPIIAHVPQTEAGRVRRAERMERERARG